MDMALRPAAEVFCLEGDEVMEVRLITEPELKIPARKRQTSCYHQKGKS